jgi:7,8-dihydroneopterin aldolase/epimerase/oxygenase
MDKIFISGIDCVTAIGVTTEERTIPQRLSIDIEFGIDNPRAAQTDSIRDTIDYSNVAGAVAGVCGGREYHLIETVAEKIAERLLADFATPQVRVLVRKHSPVLQPRVNYVSVEILRTR